MSSDKSETEKPVPLMLRLPPALHEQIVSRAKARGVSMNSLVIELLDGALVSSREYAFAVLNAEMREASHRADEHERNARETREYLVQLGKEYFEMSREIRESGRDPDAITRANAIRALTGGTADK